MSMIRPCGTFGLPRLRVATIKQHYYATAKKAMFVSNLRSERPPPNAPIHMHVLDDIGGGYDSTSGVYVAPYSGWYTIHFQLFPREPPHNLFNVDLHHNGATVARARCYEVDYAVTCNSGVTLHANVGDQLWIQSDFHAGRYYTAGFDNLFSAILVSPDE